MVSLTPQGLRFCVNSYFTSLSLTFYFGILNVLKELTEFAMKTMCFKINDDVLVLSVVSVVVIIVTCLTPVTDMT